VPSFTGWATAVANADNRRIVMRALVIDDEQLVLEGLEAFLQAANPELSLDKTADATTALRMAQSVQYELVLLDWHLVNERGDPLDGCAMVKALRGHGCQAPILIVSGDDRPDWPSLLLELGLSGVVPKSAPGSRLLDAIQVAMRGGIFLPPQTLAQRANSRYRAANPPEPMDPKEKFPDLTDRQAEVFRVLVRGLSDKAIARELGITEATVKTHIRSILSVVGVHRRGEAVFEITNRCAGAADG
jgi:two-component system, NarL family, nitrate/nitrite response regulator NarL